MLAKNARRLLALTAGVHETCRLIPPLIVNKTDLDEGLAIFADAVRVVAAKPGVGSADAYPVLRGRTGGSSFAGA